MDNKLATLNMIPGKHAYTEDLIKVGHDEYRLWNPYRSKLSAAIINGLKTFAIKPGASVLYLGAATGTTCSHISDIIGREGTLYCVEFSERNMRNLLGVCAGRENMLPILADARNPELYADMVEQCDVIYQDVSTRSQAEVLADNANSFLKQYGTAYFIIKSQSIDISKKPSDVFKKELDQLRDGFELKEQVRLEPYDKLHMFAVLTKQ